METDSRDISDDQRPSSVFERLESYPWVQDVEFQGGLSAILGSNASPDRAEELTLRARCFFYSRKYNVPVDFDAYTSWRRERQLGSVVGEALDVDQTTLNRPSTNGDIPERAQHTSAGSSEQARSSSTSAPDLTSSTEPVPYPATFARIVELITTGEPIPGIKDIPDTVLDGRESHSTTPSRRKPWEKDHQPGTDGPGYSAGGWSRASS